MISAEDSSPRPESVTGTPQGQTLNNDSLLDVRNLQIEFPTARGVLTAVRNVSFSLKPGEVRGLVGESGSGKSVTAGALLGLVRPPGRVNVEAMSWQGRSIKDPRRQRELRGSDIALIPQEPVRSLNPLGRVGNQIAEVLRVHHPDMDKTRANAAAIDLLDDVGISSPATRAGQYPHELSGGMCQRVLIALALASEPQLLIADEPTTSLDVTIQAQIIDLLKKLKDDRNLAILFITHDLGLVGQLCDSIMVMYAGRVMESGTTRDVFTRPQLPYTAGLLRSTPTLGVVQHRLPAIPGFPPDPVSPPTGCPFHPRCWLAGDRCVSDLPELEAHREREPDHEAACWEALNVSP